MTTRMHIGAAFAAFSHPVDLTHGTPWRVILLYAALKLVDAGIITPSTRGAAHGEVGHTQFLPKNVLTYGVGGSLDSAPNALNSTANFLKGHGWQRGAGYQPGEPNFAAIHPP